jgi:hypothetical protein
MQWMNTYSFLRTHSLYFAKKQTDSFSALKEFGEIHFPRLAYMHNSNPRMLLAVPNSPSDTKGFFQWDTTL